MNEEQQTTDKMRILAVDDSEDQLIPLVQLLERAGFEVESASNGIEAIEKARRILPDVVLLDVMMPPGMNGFQVTEQLKSDPILRFTPVVLLTAQDTLEDVQHGFDSGADDYIKKPFRKEELLARLRAALRVRQTYLELERSLHTTRELQGRLGERSGLQNMIGKSGPIQGIFSLLDKVAEANVPVLVTGESGTGKELVASALHYLSTRRDRPLVVANCSAFNENLLESELFGHVKGSFTGAVRDKQGLFEAADGGTFFLDELGEMSAALQVKLLRVLQDGTFTPVGSTKMKKVDVRIVAATNRDLHKMVSQGLFREDLYYRLSVVHVPLPPLRDRRTDIPLLIEHFLKQYQSLGDGPKAMSDDAVRILSAYDWPGNIRQLQNEVQRVILMSVGTGTITYEHVSPYISASQGTAVGDVFTVKRGSLKDAIESLEREMIREALERLGGNKSEASRELGISRSNLITKVQEFGLEPIQK